MGRGVLLPNEERSGERPTENFLFWISSRRILVQTGCFLYSSPKAGLNVVPTVKITLGTPGVPAGNDPWTYVAHINESRICKKTVKHETS